MAFDKKPSTWLGAGYSLTASVISMNTATHAAPVTLPQLTDTNANATTGDIRNVSFALVEALYQAWVTQGTFGHPAKMTISRTASGSSDGTLAYNYNLQFRLSPGGVYSLTAE